MEELSFIETLQRAGLTDRLIGKVPRLTPANIQSVQLTDKITIHNLAGQRLWWLTIDNKIVDSSHSLTVVMERLDWWVQFG